jgi:DNA-binding MurR/RpiR family transcriptional regulator
MAEASREEVAPRTVDEVRARILEVYERLPKRLRQCADYVVQHPEKIAVSTVADLAAGAQVPPSAYIRFCQLLGFSGFSEMQRLYREAYAERWPDYATRLEKLRDRDGAVGPLLVDFVGAGHKSLNLLVETIEYPALERAVLTLARSTTIHVVGLRRSFPAATYLTYVFEKMEIPTTLHDGVGGLVGRSSLRPGDALIAISFAPYTPETVALASDAAKRGASVVSITDGTDSPLRDVPGEVLTVREVDVGSFRAMSATLSLATTIAVAVGAARSR